MEIDVAQNFLATPVSQPYVLKSDHDDPCPNADCPAGNANPFCQVVIVVMPDDASFVDECGADVSGKLPN